MCLFVLPLLCRVTPLSRAGVSCCWSGLVGRCCPVFSLGGVPWSLFLLLLLLSLCLCLRLLLPLALLFGSCRRLRWTVLCLCLSVLTGLVRRLLTLLCRLLLLLCGLPLCLWLLRRTMNATLSLLLTGRLMVTTLVLLLLRHCWLLFVPKISAYWV